MTTFDNIKEFDTLTECADYIANHNEITDYRIRYNHNDGVVILFYNK